MYNGPFHLYFAGRGSKNGVQLKQELGCDQLYSQLNERAHYKGQWQAAGAGR